MEADLIYPLSVDFPIVQDIWELYEIYIWHVIMFKIGKSKTFRYFQYRYEMVAY